MIPALTAFAPRETLSVASEHDEVKDDDEEIAEVEQDPDLLHLALCSARSWSHAHCLRLVPWRPPRLRLNLLLHEKPQD